MFKQALTEIIQRTEGATGALIMGMDGIAVERVFLPEGDDSNMDVAATEVTSLVRGALPRRNEHRPRRSRRDGHKLRAGAHTRAHVLLRVLRRAHAPPRRQPRSRALRTPKGRTPTRTRVRTLTTRLFTRPKHSTRPRNPRPQFFNAECGMVNDELKSGS